MIPELVYANRRVIGTLEDGVFTQHVKPSHILRLYNAKGMDLAVYESLKGRCHTWRLIFNDARILSMPFEKIALVGFDYDAGAGFGKQKFVKLDDFNEEQAALQAKML